LKLLNFSCKGHFFIIIFMASGLHQLFSMNEKASLVLTIHDRSFENRIMKCTVCRTSVDAVENVIDDDWIFCFFDGKDEHGPLCPSCSDLLLQPDLDGDYELKEEFKGKIAYDDQLEHDEEEEPLDQVVLGFILN
jgi:hypothetical protein